jgi:hypothetical protein
MFSWLQHVNGFIGVKDKNSCCYENFSSLIFSGYVGTVFHILFAVSFKLIFLIGIICLLAYI